MEAIRQIGAEDADWCRGCCSVQGRRQGLFFTAGYLRFLLMVINDGKRASEAAIVQKEAAQ